MENFSLPRSRVVIPAAKSKYARDPAYGNPPNWSKLYAEHCPERTCPSSRHAKIICEDILRSPSSPVRRMLIDAGYEPDHWASSIEVTVRMLWEARRFLEWDNEKGEWIPKATRLTPSDQTGRTL